MLSAYAHPTKRLQLVAIFSPSPLFLTLDVRIAQLSRLEVKLDNSKTESALIAAEGMDVGLADVRSTSFGHDLKMNSHTERRRWLQAANRAAGGRDVGFADEEGWRKDVVGGCGGEKVIIEGHSSMEGKVGAWMYVERQGMVVFEGGRHLEMVAGRENRNSDRS